MLIKADVNFARGTFASFVNSRNKKSKIQEFGIILGDKI